MLGRQIKNKFKKFMSACDDIGGNGRGLNKCVSYAAIHG